MKRFLPSIVFVLICVAVSFGQAPKGINYQGVARDNEGNPLASKTISVRISILKTSANGEVEYAETHKPVTNQFGLFTLVIGQGTKVTGDFAFISWAIGNKWLQIEIDPNGGSAYTLAGSQQLMTVPYAFYAEYTGSSSISAGQGISINSGVVSNTGDADKDPTNELQNLADVLTKSNNAGTIKITNLGDPLATTDAATKNYVDTQNALQNLADILTKGNDAGARQIKNLGVPTDDNDAATKNYVDSLNALDLDTDPTNELQDLSQVLTRGTDAGGRKITNLALPTLPSDAATKNYVDTQNAMDLDQVPTNELQNLAQVLSQGANANDAGNKTITNLATPIVNSDAATKNYVDTQNALDLDKVPTNELQNLAQVLSQGANANDAGNKTITNLAAPIVSSDAATKNYVDTNFAFKTSFSFTNFGINYNNSPLPLIEEFDLSDVVSSSKFTAKVSGVYLFSATAKTNGPDPLTISIKITTTSTTYYLIKRHVAFPGGATADINHLDTIIYNLSAGDEVELVITSVDLGDRLDGFFFGYKL